MVQQLEILKVPYMIRRNNCKNYKWAKYKHLPTIYKNKCIPVGYVRTYEKYVALFKISLNFFFGLFLNSTKISLSNQEFTTNHAQMASSLRHLSRSVPDPYECFTGPDPDPRIRFLILRIRILLIFQQLLTNTVF
jgi:hypothetical protein